MPKPPGDLGQFDKVNYVIDAWARPCDAPWYIYIETLKPALLEAFITLLTFGWDDVARGYLRPRGLNMRRTGKRKGKWARAVPRFPELGELIGENLPGSDAAKGTKWSNGLKTLWRIDSAVQGLLFWWLVADVTVDLAFNWTSVLYETRWCQASAKGRFSWRKGITETILQDAWNSLGFTIEDYEFPFPNWIITRGNTGPNGATIAFSLDVEPFFPASPPSSYSYRIIDMDTREVWATNGPDLPDLNGNGVSVLSAPLPRNRRFEAQVFAADAPARAIGGAIIGMED